MIMLPVLVELDS